MRKKLTNPSVFVLILANCVPLYGVINLDWSLLSVLILFWTESAVIGFWNVAKMLLAREEKSKQIEFSPKRQIAIPLFIFHFGLFMIMHYYFINIFFRV